MEYRGGHFEHSHLSAVNKIYKYFLTHVVMGIPMSKINFHLSITFYDRYITWHNNNSAYFAFSIYMS